MGEKLPRELPEGIPEEDSERARKLQYQLFVLEAKLENTNFENEEAYRRQINEKRGELEQLRRQ